MNKTDSLRGVDSKVQISTKVSFFLLITLSAVVFLGCGGPATGPNGVDLTAAAATVNGKAITMEEVERAFKQQAQGQEGRLSPLEVAAARLQILQSLIEQEVMYQKAEKEGTLPTDEEVNAEYNKRRTASGLSQEQWDARMKEVGETEVSAKTAIKKGLAIQKLTDKITGKIEPPKDSEIDAFYNGNKAAFVRKKGVKLAAIVVDPANNGEGDTTTDEASAVAKANEIINQLRTGADFASVAREKSEDQSRFQGGDLGYISEEEMRQTMPGQTVQALMNPQTQVGQIVNTTMNGKFYILKLQERSDKDEDLTLESPGVRQQVTDSLINARKQLLAASYQSMAMNEARIVNNLAQRVVENPNELSGARPAQPANVNTSVANTNTANANAAANSNASTSNTNAATTNSTVTNAASGNANR
jgi:parvulin-like peptidyl-prolyl isomerase